MDKHYVVYVEATNTKGIVFYRADVFLADSDGAQAHRTAELCISRKYEELCLGAKPYKVEGFASYISREEFGTALRRSGVTFTEYRTIHVVPIHVNGTG